MEEELIRKKRLRTTGPTKVMLVLMLMTLLMISLVTFLLVSLQVRI